MNSRRDFFKKIVGRSNVERIPLNRLKELPGNIIEQIEPVFFPDEIWLLKNNLLLVPEQKLEIELTEIEVKAFGYFKKGINLKQVANEIKNNSELPIENIYQTVTTLFFKIASLRICHPKEVYHIDELIEANRMP
jgi:hypothetical protein